MVPIALASINFKLWILEWYPSVSGTWFGHLVSWCEERWKTAFWSENTNRFILVCSLRKVGSLVLLIANLNRLALHWWASNFSMTSLALAIYDFPQHRNDRYYWLKLEEPRCHQTLKQHVRVASIRTRAPGRGFSWHILPEYRPNRDGERKTLCKSHLLFTTWVT